MFKPAITAGLKTGTALSITTALAVMAASKRDSGNAWNAVNAICHITDGDDVSQPTGFQTRESLLGLGLNTIVMVVWGLLYEGGLSAARRRSTVATAAATAGAIYLIDYKIAPDRYKPGIEKRITSAGVLFAYLTLGATLSLSPLWNKQAKPKE